jgi:hypothetical protein
MCQRQQILAATDIVTKIPDELNVNTDEVKAVVTVLRLLGQLLDTKGTTNEGASAKS